MSTLKIVSTALSLGLNLVIERLRINPKWRWALLAVVLVNEARGVYFAYEGATYLLYN